MRSGQELVLNGEIILSGYVIADADAFWQGDGDSYICPTMVREALASFPGRVTIRLCSDGGDPSAGEAIRSMISQHPGGVEMIVEGIAASAASLLFMGASRRAGVEMALAAQLSRKAPETGRRPSPSSR